MKQQFIQADTPPITNEYLEDLETLFEIPKMSVFSEEFLNLCYHTHAVVRHSAVCKVLRLNDNIIEEWITKGGANFVKTLRGDQDKAVKRESLKLVNYHWGLNILEKAYMEGDSIEKELAVERLPYGHKFIYEAVISTDIVVAEVARKRILYGD